MTVMRQAALAKAKIRLARKIQRERVRDNDSLRTASVGATAGSARISDDSGNSDKPIRIIVFATLSAAIGNERIGIRVRLFGSTSASMVAFDMAICCARERNLD